MSEADTRTLVNEDARSHALKHMQETGHPTLCGVREDGKSLFCAVVLANGRSDAMTVDALERSHVKYTYSIDLRLDSVKFTLPEGTVLPDRGAYKPLGTPADKPYVEFLFRYESIELQDGSSTEIPPKLLVDLHHNGAVEEVASFLFRPTLWNKLVDSKGSKTAAEKEILSKIDFSYSYKQVASEEPAPDNVQSIADTAILTAPASDFITA
ncbi:hypothetical protein [Rhodoligotrophos defluvii]|uniref:hypothetical protein n=1 Tax=Rhodoligotrophos defluvii TaxID=2561934 RepID=UPI0010C99B90|nr:hypothetical protein [Rhodoligotrophos defluvii]